VSRPDPDEHEWELDLRKTVTRYMESTGVNHGAIGEKPAWAVFPHLAI
jgi:hypothetical protein